jgi:hypothetical protein
LRAFWEKNHPEKGQKGSQNAFSDSYPCQKKAFGPTQKREGKSPNHNFACSLLSSSPRQQKKFGTRSFELVIA